RDTETLFNRGQPAGSPVLRGPIRDDDIMKLKCDSHGWMQGYVVVGDNPYHATSGEDGRFTIERAPAGSYELQAWHEYYGVKTAKVTVEEGKTATVDFTFDAEKDMPASAGGSP
ncbi:MAG TPA: carboxypeptidase-like regulatory domain-containing protein, partial [Kofleriaceae bacterium]|nr:carboxypeptidase-like regulatory domain-containing protein [Kofleriaceae bacterium]